VPSRRGRIAQRQERKIMPTGTEGPDTFLITSVETYYGLGGDDAFSLAFDIASEFNTTPQFLRVEGGEGFDTFSITASLVRALYVPFDPYQGSVWVFGGTSRKVGTVVDYVGIERIYVSSTADFSGYPGGQPGAGGWSTGDTIDEIHVNGVVGNHAIGVFTGGNDDKIYLGAVGNGSAGHGGSGNDLVDLSGFLGSSASAFGDEGDDILVGSGQADTLDGGSGVDSMSGGGGDDIYIVDNSGDAIVEADGAGTDTARVSAAAYVLAEGVENLVATDSGPHNFTLNSGDNIVTGNSGADLLRLQQGGADSAAGQGGNDIFYLGGALDLSDVLDGGSGTDTLVLQGDYRFGLLLGSNVSGIESITLLAGSNTAFGEPGTNRYDYVIVVSDSNFAPGLQARINGAGLLAGEDFTFNGSGETDASFVVYGGRGEDALLGGRGNDVFFFAEDGRFAPGDAVDGGPGYDGLFLRGNYTIDFNDPGYSGALRNLENLTLSSIGDERYARGGGTDFDYDIVWANALLGAGGSITVNGALLQANETMNFDGSAETDGSFRIFAGAAHDLLSGGSGADLILGGLGGDTINGGAGNDVFRYDSASDSTLGARDRVEDFAAGDKVDLSRIDAATAQAGDQAFSFIGAAVFGNHAGELRVENLTGTSWLVQGDTNGDGTADFELLLVVVDSHALTSGDFIL
jgi:Ca2+-binding RTX toxin-like protein